MRLTHVMSAAAVLLAAAGLGAQTPPPPPPQPAAPAPAGHAGEGEPPEAPKFDPAAVERGKQLLVAQCGFCHGSNARGGAQGPDLTRSALVQDDEGGKQLGAFLKVGRPELKMPKFDLADGDVSDLATFLHAAIHRVASRDKYRILDIVVGDPRAGEAFFNGAGRCNACHSPSGDLKGVGAKYDDTATLQGRLVMPRGRRRRGPPKAGVPETPAYLEPNVVKATVTLPSGESFTGPLVRLTDFDVTLYDPASAHTRSWLRSGGSPAVALTDPLQAHVDMLRRWTDADLHDMTAFLATLK